jgi:uncharacterized protein involved in cysteine biosynthesis
MADEFEVEGMDAPAARPSPAAEPMVYVAMPRPGFLRRAGAGAWHVFSGLWFLVRRPFLWPLAALPTLLAVVFIVGGLLLGAFSIRWLEGAILPAQGKLPVGLGLILMLALWIGAIGAGVVLGLALALLLTAPLLERLSRRVEEVVRVSLPAGQGNWRWELAQSFRGALYVLLAAPVVLLLSLIPLIGPLLGLGWASFMLSMQQAEIPLTRRGLDFKSRRAWHKRFLPESMGFGAAGLVMLVVPCANFLLAPALMVGGTLMVLELEEDLVPPDRAEGRPAAAAAPLDRARSAR